jgi:hypothetical protein
MKLSIDDLYTAADRELAKVLLQEGFQSPQPGEYLRLDANGQDRILVDPDERKRGFSILLSYYPDDLRMIEELSDSNEPRGFPCGPYLSPAGVGRREYLWSYGSREHLRASLDSARAALAERALPWLQLLRDPSRFAEEVDPVAALYGAYAYERAGDSANARRLYEEMYRRLVGGLGVGVSETEFLRRAGKKYIFVAKKLSVDEVRVKRFEQQLSWSPDVRPLGI